MEEKTEHCTPYSYKEVDVLLKRHGSTLDQQIGRLSRDSKEYAHEVKDTVIDDDDDDDDDENNYSQEKRIETCNQFPHRVTKSDRKASSISVQLNYHGCFAQYSSALQRNWEELQSLHDRSEQQLEWQLHQLQYEKGHP